MAFSTPSYGQAGSYTAANDRTLTKANARTAGVRRLIPASAGAMQGDLAVTTTGAGNGSVNVAAGDVWIDDGTGTAFYFSNNGASVVAGPFAANSSGTSRTDLVYVLVTDTGASAPTIAVSIATGSVVVPAKAVGLATVVIPNGFTVSTTVLAANITDVRPKAQVPDLSVTSTSAVASPKSGNLVFDTSTAPQGKLKVYDNSGAWVQVATTTGSGFTNSDLASGYLLVSQGTVAPSSPVDGQLWFDTTNQRLMEYRSSDTTWQRIAHTAAVGRTGGHWRQSQGINTTWATALGWATEDYDTDNFIVAGGSNRIFTIPAGLGGLYMATLRTDSQNGSGSGQVVIQWTTAAYGVTQDVGESGAAVGSAIVGSSTTGRMSVTGMQYMAAGDTITCYSRWSTSATSATHEFQLVRLSI